MVTNLITRTFPIPYDMICTKRGRKSPHSLLLHRMKKRIASVNIKNVSRLRNHQNENSVLFRDLVKQKLCSSRGNAPISQEIDESLVPKAIRDWYVDSEDEQDTISECDSDCEWEWVFWGDEILCFFDFSCFFSRKSSEVWGKWDYRFDIQLLRKNPNRQKFLWW